MKYTYKSGGNFFYKEQKWEISGVGKEQKKRTKNKIENSGEAEKNNRKNKEQRTDSKNFPRCARPVPLYMRFLLHFLCKEILAIRFLLNFIQLYFVDSLFFGCRWSSPIAANPARPSRPGNFQVLSKEQRTKNKVQKFWIRDFFGCFTSTIFVLLKEVTAHLVQVYKDLAKFC